MKTMSKLSLYNFSYVFRNEKIKAFGFFWKEHTVIKN